MAKTASGVLSKVGRRRRNKCQESTLKLEGAKNFHTWKFQQKCLMKAYNVFGVTDGTYAWTQEAHKLAKWRQVDAKLQVIVVTRVIPAILIPIQNCETAQQLWEKLNTIYEQKSNLSLHILQQNFYELKLTETEDITTYIDTVEDLVEEIKQAKGDILESMVI